MNVDINHIDRMSRELVEEDQDIVLVGSELIGSWYLDNLANEVDDVVNDKGFISVAALSSKFNLNPDLLTDVIRKHSGTKIRSTLKVR